MSKMQSRELELYHDVQRLNELSVNFWKSVPSEHFAHLEHDVKELRALVVEMMGYLDHLGNCRIFHPTLDGGWECTCGLDKLLKKGK